MPTLVYNSLAYTDSINLQYNQAITYLGRTADGFRRRVLVLELDNNETIGSFKVRFAKASGQSLTGIKFQAKLCTYALTSFGYLEEKFGVNGSVNSATGTTMPNGFPFGSPSSGNAALLATSLVVDFSSLSLNSPAANVNNTVWTEVTFNFATTYTNTSGSVQKYIIVLEPTSDCAVMSGFNIHAGAFTTQPVAALKNSEMTPYYLGRVAGTNNAFVPHWRDNLTEHIPFMAYAETAAPSNFAPTDIALSSSSVNENQPSGTEVGTLSTTDSDAGNTFTYTLGGADAASFSIVGSSLRTASVFNREVKSSYSINVTSTDQGGLAFTKAFTISVTNVNESPTDIALSASSIMENNAVNAVIGTLSVTDPDVGDSVAFSVISGSDKFNISGTSLRASVAFDYEAATSHSVTVRATDAGGLSYDKSFTISVTNDVGDDSIVLTESTSITLSDGKVYAEITIDPRVMPVTQADGSPLPEGSVLKNASSGQKYYKLTNSPASGSATTNFVAIELVPPEEWGWSEAAEAAWEVLQGF